MIWVAKIFESYRKTRRGEGSYLSSCLGYPYLWVLFAFLIIASNSTAQWRQIAQLPLTIGTVYFQNECGHPEIGFVGSWIADWRGYTNAPAQLWKTKDGGITWANVSNPEWIGSVRDIKFTDSSNGWAAIGESVPNQPGTGGLYYTTDGGDSWNSVQGTEGYCSSIHVDAHSRSIFIGHWGIGAQASFDLGTSWQTINLDQQTSNAFVFWDSLRGLMTTVSSGGGYFPFLITGDGGHTWMKTSLLEEAWQPYVVPNTGTAYVLSEQTGTLYATSNYGLDWSPVYRFEPSRVLTTGCIRGGAGKLLVQTWSSLDMAEGIVISSDSGISWRSICGPSWLYDSRFFVFGDTILASSGGRLYRNVGGSANASRLQVGTAGAQNLKVEHRPFPVAIRYPDGEYYEHIDSISFTLGWSNNLIYVQDSAMPNWSLSMSTVADTTVRFVLHNMSSSEPKSGELLTTLFFRPYLTAERTARITLDEVNFNQDTTFRECMVASLTKNDTLFIDLTDACGDSVMREYLRHDGMLQIDAIRPNPASGAVRLSVRSAADGVAEIEVVNALGEVVASHERGLSSGMNEIELPTSTLPNGVYYVRLRTHGDTVGASVVIER